MENTENTVEIEIKIGGEYHFFAWGKDRKYQGIFAFVLAKTWVFLLPDFTAQTLVSVLGKMRPRINAGYR